MLRAGIDEVEKAGAAVELGEEDGGVGLGFRGFDPFKAGSDGAGLVTTFPEDSASIATHPHGSKICRFSARLIAAERVKKMRYAGFVFD